MEQENPNFKKSDTVFTKKIRAGKRRTYFFDIRSTKANDYFITITESKKRFNGEGYDRHKIFLYKEDFNKFVEALQEGVGKVKEMMPNFNFDEFNHDDDYNHEHENTQQPVSIDELPASLKADVSGDKPVAPPTDLNSNGAHEEVDKW